MELLRADHVSARRRDSSSTDVPAQHRTNQAKTSGIGQRITKTTPQIQNGLSRTLDRAPEIAGVIDPSRIFDNSLPDAQQASEYARICV